MDFGGMLGMEMLVGSSSCSFSSSPIASSDLESVRKMGLFGSHFLKQGRSSKAEEDDRRCTKIARSIQQPCSSNTEQMLSFSSVKPSPLTLSALPSSLAASSLGRTAAFSHGDLNVNMQGVVGGQNWPFTLSQRMELEQQMLIFNYIRENVPIPINLLCSLRRGLNPAGLSVGSSRPNAGWWGYFHPGFAGNADPEPGRCRRTDGKKWRCSRDAVPDQKYCERHINRGRHRSRKPVEGQGGHAKKVMPIISNPTSASAASAASSGGQSSNDLTVCTQLIHIPQTTADTSASRLWIMAGGKAVNNDIDKAEDASIVSSTSKPFDSLFSTSKNCNSLELESGNCLLSQLGGSFATNNNNLTSLLELHDWPSSLSDCSTITWPGVEEMQPERSQLSLPFPMASSDFSSSTSSPAAAEKLSPLHMGLGISGFSKELNQLQMSWRSSSWEAPTRASTAMAGPLGEALASTSSAGMDENKIFLSLMNESWDLSPQLASSTSTPMQPTALSSASSGSGNDLPATAQKNTQEVFSCFFGTKNTNLSSFPPL